MLIKSRIWLENEGDVVLGNGRIALMKKIIETGSLNKAALALEMSYRKAWNLIDSMNKSSKQPLIITSKGGSKGGGTVVTEYGKKKIEQFEMIRSELHVFLKEKQAIFYDD